MKDETKRILAKIKAILAYRSFSQEWLADQTGVSPALVCRWLSGSRELTLDHLASICEVLDITMVRLLSDD